MVVSGVVGIAGPTAGSGVCVCDGLGDLEWFQRGEGPGAAVTSGVSGICGLQWSQVWGTDVGAHIRVRSVWRGVRVHNQFRGVVCVCVRWQGL